MGKKISRSSDRSPPGSPEGRGPAGDIALVLGKDGDGLHILRRRSQEGTIEAGLLRPMREGKPILGEVVSLTQRPDFPMVFDVRTEFVSEGSGDAQPDGEAPPGGPRAVLEGPPQVASEAYRRGWDAVWGTGPDHSVN